MTHDMIKKGFVPEQPIYVHPEKKPRSWKWLWTPLILAAIWGGLKLTTFPLQKDKIAVVYKDDLKIQVKSEGIVGSSSSQLNPVQVVFDQKNDETDRSVEIINGQRTEFSSLSHLKVSQGPDIPFNTLYTTSL